LQENRGWQNHTLQILRPSISKTTCQINGLRVVQGGLCITPRSIAQHIDFAELAALVDGLLARGDGRKGGRPAYPSEVMVRVLAATGTASEHDGHHFEEVLDEDNTGRDVYADKAYPSKRRQEMLKALGWRDGIQRRAGKDQPLSECQKRRNQRIASKRAKVEHVFAGIRHLGGKFILTIGQARADVAMTMMAACYNIKRLAMFLHKGVDSFYKHAQA